MRAEDIVKGKSYTDGRGVRHVLELMDDGESVVVYYEPESRRQGMKREPILQCTLAWFQRWAKEEVLA